ncbi:hypothetical protein KP509_1Z284200 [Ceratopteris richardii]|nr:hypothetical protein KP509_1Z284200 [Ceratopteris richardii]
MLLVPVMVICPFLPMLQTAHFRLFLTLMGCSYEETLLLNMLSCAIDDVACLLRLSYIKHWLTDILLHFPSMLLPPFAIPSDFWSIPLQRCMLTMCIFGFYGSSRHPKMI